jgi:hypothetical protein
LNSKQKSITPTQEESEWINNHQPEHAAMLWRYAAMLNTLDTSWLDECIAPNATYASQSVLEEQEGENRIRDYFTEKLKTIQGSGNDALVRAAFAELLGTGDGNGNACVAIYQAQSEFDQSAWNRPVCCMTLGLLEGKITTFFMVTGIPSPASAEVSNLFPMSSTQPKPRSALIDETSYRELCFSLFLLDGECPIDVMAREQVDLAMQHYSGAIYREVITIPASREADFETSQLGFVGFPSLAVTLNGKVLYRHTGLIGAERLSKDLRSAYK